jgi:hypothetical protein
VRKIIFLTRAHSVSAWGFFQLPTRISAGNSAGCRVSVGANAPVQRHLAV